MLSETLPVDKNNRPPLSPANNLVERKVVGPDGQEMAVLDFADSLAIYNLILNGGNGRYDASRVQMTQLNQQ